MKDRWDKVSQSLVTSHSVIRRKGSAHMRGMNSFGSVLTCSGWGFSHIGRFLSAQDDDTGERVVSQGGGFAAFFIGRCPKVVFKSRVTSHNNDTSRPLETEVPQRDFRVWPNPKRRLACPLRRLPVRPNGPRQRRRMDPRSGVKNYVRLPVSLKRHPDRSGGIFLADR